MTVFLQPDLILMMNMRHPARLGSVNPPGGASDPRPVTSGDCDDEGAVVFNKLTQNATSGCRIHLAGQIFPKSPLLMHN